MKSKVFSAVKAGPDAFPCLQQQVPQGLLPFETTGKPVKWGIVLKTAQEVFQVTREELEAVYGPLTVHLVSDVQNPDPTKRGRFGVASIGTFADEPNDLFTFYERGGGGSGAIHYCVTKKGTLLIGVVPAARNRKAKLRGLECPRGYDDAAKLTETVAQRLETAKNTAENESHEEATTYASMTSRPITWADGSIVGTDANGAVMGAGTNEGFKYSCMEWPSGLLRGLNKQGVVHEPDYNNPLVSASGGDVSHGHTGKMFFVPLAALFDKSYLPAEWSDGISVDGLGMTGILALQEMLKREGRVK